MNRLLNLSPDAVRIKKYQFDSSPEGSVLKTLLDHLRQKLSLIMTSGNFNEQRIRTALPRMAQNFSKKALDQAIREGKKKWDKRYMVYGDENTAYAEQFPLLALISPKFQELDAVLVEGIDVFEQPPEFIEAMILGVQKELADARFLTTLSDHRNHAVMCQGILPFLRKVQKAIQDKDEVSEVFEIVKSARERDDIVLPFEDMDKFYFLIFLPNKLRYAIQELLIHKSLIRGLEDQKARATEDQIQLIGIFQEYLKATILANSHWGNIIKWWGADESISLEIGQLRRDAQRLHDEIQTMMTKQDCRDFLIKFHKVISSLPEAIRTVDNHGGSYVWQMTDIGHGFNNNAIDHLTSLSHTKNTNIAEKNGRKAVILEDDPAQMSEYETLLQQKSPYVIRATCTTPAELNSVIDDPEVGYFLLDIKNSEDNLVGIKMAIEILRRRFVPLSGMNEHQLGHQSHTTIQVWTSSKELYDIATSELRKVIAELHAINFHVVNGLGCSGGIPPISLKLAMKSDEIRYYW